MDGRGSMIKSAIIDSGSPLPPHRSPLIEKTIEIFSIMSGEGGESDPGRPQPLDKGSHGHFLAGH